MPNEASGGSTTRASEPLKHAADEAHAVLVIDDDDSVAESLCAVLDAVGFRTRRAVDGNRALALLDAEKFDVVLTDIFMPELDGMEVIDAIRKRGLDIPIIVLTGRADWGEVDWLKIAYDLGANLAISKPIAPRDLVDNIRKVVEQTRENPASS
jgi:CheY-like chemotaxis protein